ncbi:MAG: hypothetical protein QME72_16330 [Rhodococcus sp. (in: high G+C Gram-positive bacteria)]|nr:hypothetical protein [Rhodococcus sp. (in: high G+C Gram-positive bacteria)]MDI6629279.1 hypothetical protein [Rhodococcus sp. (in: high G+C Gram-positive bacteria)]
MASILPCTSTMDADPDSGDGAVGRTLFDAFGADFTPQWDVIDLFP